MTNYQIKKQLDQANINYRLWQVDGKEQVQIYMRKNDRQVSTMPYEHFRFETQADIQAFIDSPSGN